MCIRDRSLPRTQRRRRARTDRVTARSPERGHPRTTPSRVAPGDLLLLRGLNLAPADQVLIASKPAQILSVAPDQIRVQVPFDVPVGLVNVVVQRGEVRSRPVSVRVMANAVAARTKNDLGFGEAGVIDGNRLSVSMTGFGSAEPKGVRAYVGGLPAEAKAVLSEARAGEFDVAIDLPEGSLPGDIVSVSNGGVPATRSTLGAASDAVVQYV